jgi:hypothetical protein
MGSGIGDSESLSWPDPKKGNAIKRENNIRMIFFIAKKI